MKRIAVLALVLLNWIPFAQAASTSAVDHLGKPLEWFKTEEAATIAANILSYQADTGEWPKNVDTAAAPYTGDRSKLHGTYDNKATTDELRYLARMVAATGDAKYKEPFVKGLETILKAQYDNGGWPQSYPPGKGYERYITFNDGCMARLMFFLKDVVKEDTYQFLDEATRARCKQAIDKGVECMLKCQVKVDGKLTVWCAQHDNIDFSAKPARTFELASLSGGETLGIVHFLMYHDNQTPEIIAAVDAVYAWYDAVRIKGIRVEDRPMEGTPKGYERYVVEDPTAPDMWARFYEIGTNKPIFVDRDGIPKYHLSEIGIERRTGYKWLGYFPKNFLEKEYPEWKAKKSGAQK